MTSYTLWGFHPRYTGKDGAPYLIRLAVGSARACAAESRSRTRQGGWRLNTYRSADAPVGLAAVLKRFLEEA